MPELPEVETVARGLRSALLGQRLRAVELRQPAILRSSARRGPQRGSRVTAAATPGRSAARLAHARTGLVAREPQADSAPAVDLGVLAGGVVREVERGGKYLVFTIEKDAAAWQLMVHLGMTGQLVLRPAAAERQPHTHVIFTLDDDRELHFRDPRRFGRLALAPAPAGGFADTLGVASGAEPLSVGPEAFVALFRGRQAPIKNALMNQKLLRGLGNIYADESLFRAGITPRARSLSRPRLLRLRRAIRAVLREAIAAGGSSISDYVASDGQPGWFHLEHRVYGREGQPCLRCCRSIRRIVLAGRSAHYCPKCQRR